MEDRLLVRLDLRDALGRGWGQLSDPVLVEFRADRRLADFKLGQRLAGLQLGQEDRPSRMTEQVLQGR